MLSILVSLRVVTAIVLVVLAAALLWRPRRRDPARVWLGVLLAVNAVLVLGGVARSFGYLSAIDSPAAFSLLFAAYAVSPLCLLRVVSSTADPRPLGWRDLITFAPAGLLAVGLVAASVAPGVGPERSIFAANTTWWIALAVLHGIAVAAFVLAGRRLAQAPPWMRGLFAAFVVHWAFSALSSVAALSGWPGALTLEAASLTTLLLFAIGAAVAGVRLLAKKLPTVATFEEADELAPTDPADAALGGRLRTLFESEKVYLDQNLTLDVLAARAEASSRDVSRVLNTILGGGYHDVVRRYRVQRAQQLMRRDPDATILSVLYEAGFSSTSAFHRAFREQVGTSPGVWRDDVRDDDVRDGARAEAGNRAQRRGAAQRSDRRPGHPTS